jgi:hypothetical protein
MGTKSFDMMLKLSWVMICIMVKLRTRFMETHYTSISMVNVARCEILIAVLLRICLLCDGVLLGE